ncbi:MAG: helix-turn-helix domain-containing protein [Cytophagales bacterium]|nr:MAG: helix-turn-helix domain-containing protein [Cytophagales bacterium]
MTGIPLYTNINDLHRVTGSALRTNNPLIHCFDMAETNNLLVGNLPPHRADFYTLALNLDTQGLQYTLNQNDFREPKFVIVCVAPGQVVQWSKEGDWFGYCLFFKGAFLEVSTPANFLQQYPFFNVNETNLLPIEPVHSEAMQTNFRQLIAEQQTAAAFSNPIMQATLQALLWQVRRVYEETNRITPSTKARAIITAQFQYLVNEHFRTLTTVDEYADRLNITANHLSQTVRETIGKSAKRIISQRRLTEACYLLQYTSNTIAEIGDHLCFSESTHFVKFFKKETGNTPVSYRSNRMSTSSVDGHPQKSHL